MRKMSSSLIVPVLLAASQAGALSVDLTVQERAGVARKPGMITCGVPFARGALKNPDLLAAESGGQAVPAQFGTLAKWDDGSVRWALLDCQLELPAGEQRVLSILDSGRNPAPAAGIRLSESADGVTVSTGPLTFTVSRTDFTIFQSLKLDGGERLAPGSKGFVLHTEDGKIITAGKPSRVAVEAAGPLRAVVCVKGVFPDVHNGLLAYTVRITAYAGSKTLKLRAWLENNGAHGFDKTKPEWLFLKGLSIELAFADAVRATLSCEGVRTNGHLRVFQTCAIVTKRFLPGSGDRPVCGKGGFNYRIDSGDRELAKGERTDGVFAVETEALKLNAVALDFWQNYDQAIEFDHGTLRLWPWPLGSQWPRKGLNYDKGAAWAIKEGLTAIPGGVHKGHEWLLDFSGRTAAESIAELSAPLAAVNPASFAATEAANILFAPMGAKSGDDELDWKLAFRDNMVRNILDPASKTSLAHARGTEGEWYGWMDFGDVSSPSGGYYAGWIQNRSLHYDWTLAVLLHYLRTGDPALLKLGTEMARHLQEIDQSWSDHDPAPANRLFRPDGSQQGLHTAFHTPSVDRNWVGGVVLYHLLTGDPKALECIERNAEGIRQARVENLRKDPNAWRGDRDNTLQTTLLTIGNLMSLHTLDGDKRHLDDIQTLVANHLLPANKELGPHLYNPDLETAGQGYNELGQQLAYGVAALCDYHYRTRNEAAGRLLEAMAQKGLPTSFYEAGLFFSDLYVYLGWLNNDQPMIEKGMRAFADGFPESRTPAVFFEERKDWTVRPPMMLRAGSLMHYLCWRAKK